MSDLYPEEWQQRSLASLGSYENGFAFSEIHWSKHGLPIVRIAQITGSQGIVDRYPGKLPDTYLINDGDLIFSWSGTLAVVRWSGGPAWLNQHLFKVMPATGVDRLFLFHLLQASVAEMSKRTHGSTMKHIKRGELQEFLVEMPSSENEQKKIAQVLDTIDEAIHKTEAIIEKLKAVKQGLLNDLLTRGVDVNGLLRPPQCEAPQLYHESPLGWIPKDWKNTNLGKVASLQRGHDIVEADLVLGPYPVISSSGLVGYHNSSTSRGPNVVVGRKGSIGTVHYLENDFWAHDTSLFVTNFYGNNEKFVFHLFNYLKLAQYGTKSGSPSLNRNDIHPLPVGLPKPTEQTLIVQILAAHDESMKRSELERDKLMKTKSALMEDLLTGRIRVTPLLESATS